MRFIAGAALIAGTIILASPPASGQATAKPTVVAMCGASFGKTYYAVDENSQWTDDRLSKGYYTITLDSKNNLNLLYGDAINTYVDAAADGAKIEVNHADFVDGMPQLSFTVIYPNVIETYMVASNLSGTLKLFWTSNRLNNGIDRAPKVAAFVADCSPR